jgi:hypothetical protein
MVGDMINITDEEARDAAALVRRMLRGEYLDNHDEAVKGEALLLEVLGLTGYAAPVPTPVETDPKPQGEGDDA